MGKLPFPDKPPSILHDYPKESGWWVACVATKASEVADLSILVEGETWGQQETTVKTAVAAGLLYKRKPDLLS